MRFARLGALAALVLATTVVPTAPAQAADAAACLIQIEIRIFPGLGNSPADQTFVSVPGSGTANCEGTVGGHLITGPGTDANYGQIVAGSCSSSKGTGVDKVTLPTDGGEVTVGGPFEFSTLTALGHATGDHLAGAFQARPTQGDCFSSPITKALISFEGVLKAL